MTLNFDIDPKIRIINDSVKVVILSTIKRFLSKRNGSVKTFKIPSTKYEIYVNSTLQTADCTNQIFLKNIPIASKSVRVKMKLQTDCTK